MKHAILGAGGVGGLIGSALARRGEQVTMILRPEALASHPDQLALESSVLGTFTVPVNRAPRLQQPVDVLWITVKATELDGALQLVPPEEIGESLIVPLLNGIDHLQQLSDRYGYSSVVPANLRTEAERISPGHIRQSTPFITVELVARDPLGERVEELATTVQQAGIECRVRRDEATTMWGKLAFLAPMALTTSAFAGPIGAVREDPHWRSLLEGCIRETCLVANASGASIQAQAVLDFVLETVPAGMRTSMQKDVEAGRVPELDAIAGPIVRGAAKHGIACPATMSLAELVGRKSASA